MTKALSTRAMRRRHADRIQATKLIDRLQGHALGELLTRPEVVQKVVAAVTAGIARHLEFDVDSLPVFLRDQLGKAVSALLARAGMDITQVRAAEILLKKTLPDLANTEFRGEIQHNHTVLLPQGMNADQWQAQVRSNGAAVIEHDPAPAGRVN
jgi:hypothetical protein